MKNKLILFLLLFQVIESTVYAQSDLLTELEESSKSPGIQNKVNIFKGTRLINGHTVETRDKGTFDFLITHRFGRINSGFYEFFGLDDANIRLGFDYSLSNKLVLGIGRSSYNKVYDGFIKFNIVQQSVNDQMPLSITLLGSTSITTLKSSDPSVEIDFNDRLAYTSQLLIARKFGRALSVQFMPTIVHRNTVTLPGDVNTVFALGFGGCLRINNRMFLTGEYHLRFNGADVENIYNPLSFGIDIETGGHVFQFMITNSRQMIEKGFIAETDGTWSKGDIHIGFNISRIFYLNSNNSSW